MEYIVAMFDELESLYKVADLGSVSLAAKKLHITQSAVTKRIQRLSYQLNQTLVERSGRNIQLTPSAIDFVKRTRASFLELKRRIDSRSSQKEIYTFAMPDSLMVSWGERALKHYYRVSDVPRLNVRCIHASRIREEVVLGNVDFGLIYGLGLEMPDLEADLITRDEVVIIPKSLNKTNLNWRSKVELVSLQSDIPTASLVQDLLKDWQSKTKLQAEIINSQHTFISIAVLARLGAASGIVPIGVAKALGITTFSSFPKSKVFLPISLVYRTEQRESNVLKLIRRGLKL